MKLSHIELLQQYGYLPKIGTFSFQEEREAREAFRDFMRAPKWVSDNELFDIPRCGCPDVATEDYPYVTKDELSTLATGSGAWPAGCHPDWPNNHSMVYSVNKSRMPSFLDSVFEPAWDLCAQAYADIGLVLIRDDGNPNVNSIITFERGAGWIGLAIVPGSGLRCNSKIWAKFDYRYRPSDLLNQWARLLAHEIGHNNRLSHTRGGIMNPSITSGVFTPTAWRNDPSFKYLKAFYGGEPVQPKPPTWGIYPMEPQE